MPALILIIEDDDDSRELLKYLLEAAGYVTLGAEDGRAGLELALSCGPDLILCDLKMPLISGYELAQLLQAAPDWRRVPLIAVTAFSMVGDRKAALAAGFDDHITKPITPETFVSQIEAFLPANLKAPRHSAS